MSKLSTISNPVELHYLGSEPTLVRPFPNAVKIGVAVGESVTVDEAMVEGLVLTGLFCENKERRLPKAPNKKASKKKAK